MGGSGSPKPPKMCVFGLKKQLFRRKLTNRVLNVPIFDIERIERRAHLGKVFACVLTKSA